MRSSLKSWRQKSCLLPLNLISWFSRRTWCLWWIWSKNLHHQSQPMGDRNPQKILHKTGTGYDYLRRGHPRTGESCWLHQPQVATHQVSTISTYNVIWDSESCYVQTAVSPWWRWPNPGPTSWEDWHSPGLGTGHCFLQGDQMRLRRRRIRLQHSSYYPE